MAVEGRGPSESAIGEAIDGRGRAPLRIGVMLESWAAPAWIDRILSDVSASPDFRLCLLIMNCEKVVSAPWWRRLFRWRHCVLFKVYERLDRKVMPLSPDAHASVDLSPRLAGIPIVEVIPNRKGFTHRFTEEDVRRVEEHRLDVILRFGFNILRGDVLTVARYGIWSYHHGDNREYRGGPPMFWEMHQRRTVTGTILQILTEELDAGKVIYRSHASTDMVSYCRNQNQPYWKSTAFMTRRLNDLVRDGMAGLTSTDTYREPPVKGVPILRTPTNGVMCRFLIKTASRIAANKVIKHLYRVYWFLAIKRGGRGESGEWQAIHAPRGRFYADPFIVRAGNKHYVFFEDCSLEKANGVISCFTLDAGGRHGEPRRVLERPYHLSYPCVFEWQNHHYMIPETSDNRTIELYRADQFPDKWVLDRVLMTGVNAVDTTACFHDGRFWLLSAMSERGGSVNDELFLFHADSPHGELKPHPRNPIVSDVRRARPAGLPYSEGGQLIRPGQDCSRWYGQAINLNVIETWNTREYRERLAGRIEADAVLGGRGVHTINSADGWTVADCWRHRFRFAGSEQNRNGQRSE